ncbi:unnamed protein product [Durusdinium trenchii]|uniref:Uncharacterized protein n=1 Tax=Durusdinium trenchii TaxID=1381693 RepID=A0ABP0KTS6_9DINO
MSGMGGMSGGPNMGMTGMGPGLGPMGSPPRPSYGLGGAPGGGCGLGGPPHAAPPATFPQLSQAPPAPPPSLQVAAPAPAPAPVAPAAPKAEAPGPSGSDKQDFNAMLREAARAAEATIGMSNTPKPSTPSAGVPLL